MSRPAISVILLAPYGLDKLRNILHFLKRQTIADRVQVVIPTQPGVVLSRPITELHSVRTVEVPHFTFAGPAKMLAIEAADSERSSCCTRGRAAVEAA